MPPDHIFIKFWFPTGPQGGRYWFAILSVFLGFGPSWGPNASRGSAQSPQNHPRPPFLLIFGSLLSRFLHFFDTLNAKGRRKKNQKKGQHSVLFLKIFWWRNSRHSTELSPSPAGHFWQVWARWREGRRQLDNRVRSYNRVYQIIVSTNRRVSKESCFNQIIVCNPITMWIPSRIPDCQFCKKKKKASSTTVFYRKASRIPDCNFCRKK